MRTELSNLSQKIYQRKGEDRQGISVIKIMVRGIIKIDVGQIMETEE